MVKCINCGILPARPYSRFCSIDCRNAMAQTVKQKLESRQKPNPKPYLTEAQVDTAISKYQLEILVGEYGILHTDSLGWKLHTEKLGKNEFALPGVRIPGRG